MNEDAETLDAFVAHPGFQLYTAHVAEEWGPTAYARKIKAAVQHARQVGKDASQAIELVDAANDAVAEIMRWPEGEAARLKRQHQPQEVTMSRRGGL